LLTVLLHVLPPVYVCIAACTADCIARLTLLLLYPVILQVSMLDDKVWQVLAELPAPEALAVIDDAGQALLNPHAQIRNINAYFMVSYFG
jgi:hypothetical protein